MLMTDIITTANSYVCNSPGSEAAAIILDMAAEIGRLREKVEILEAEIRVMRQLPGTIAALSATERKS